MTLLSQESLALLTDLYQLTMAYGYWKLGMDKTEAVFHLFFRRPPFKGGFTMACGLETVVSFVETFRYTEEDLRYLGSLESDDGSPMFDSAFLHWLKEMKLEVDIDAVPEGTVVYPYEPLVRVKGPLIACQLLETPLLNLINFSTLIATKAARMNLAAKGEPILEFGLRRAQGIDGGVTASRSAYVGGVNSTSNVLAGRLFGIPVKGTHAHSWVLAFDDEFESFKAYAKSMPHNCVLLVDTFNTIEGVRKACEIGVWLKTQGKKLLGIRLDSGDLAKLSIESRKILDEAGLEEALILASNELDEILISELKRQGAKINCWGVGTKLVTGDGQSALDGVYKLSGIKHGGKDWEYKLKLSEQMHKISNPGILQVRRFFDGKRPIADVVWDELIGIKSPTEFVDPLDPTKKKKISGQFHHKDLLVPIFKKGQKVYTPPSLEEVRKYAKENLDTFGEDVKRFYNPHLYLIGFEKQYHELKLRLIDNLRHQTEEVH